MLTPLIALAVACESPSGPSDDADLDGIPSDFDECPDAGENLNKVFDDDGCPDTTLDLYQVVRSDVEGFWTAILAPTEWSYVPISVFQPYTKPIATPCGTAILDNALYCPRNTGVYFDLIFLDTFLDLVGDMAPAFVIGHEIGHHVSAILGWGPPALSEKETELQADCFAGAWAKSAEDRGLLDEGDLDEAVAALITVGDPRDTWFSPQGHGTPEQRIKAFEVGFDDGAGACTQSIFFDLFPAPPR